MTMRTINPKNVRYYSISKEKIHGKHLVIGSSNRPTDSYTKKHFIVITKGKKHYKVNNWGMGHTKVLPKTQPTRTIKRSSPRPKPMFRWDW